MDYNKLEETKEEMEETKRKEGGGGERRGEKRLMKFKSCVVLFFLFVCLCVNFDVRQYIRLIIYCFFFIHSL